jgi:hypothetical protein
VAVVSAQPYLAGDELCDGVECSNLWRVQLRGDGGRWCRTCEPAARAAFEVLCALRKAPDPPPLPCTLCGAEPARLYPDGWRCDLHSPAAMRARS